jgi:ankyrin repeat protein
VHVVRELLQHSKVDVYVRDKKGSAGLDVARVKGHVDVASLLERHSNEHVLAESVMGSKRQTPPRVTLRTALQGMMPR